MLITAFDLETTYNDPSVCRTVQLAYSVYDTIRGCEPYSYCTFLWDESYQPIDPGASEVNGITDEEVKVHGIDPKRAFSFLIWAFNKSDYIMAHNGRLFDCEVLKHEFKRYGLEWKDWKQIDTRYDLPYPDKIESRKLLYLGAEHGYLNPNPHHALSDVAACIALFKKYPIEEILERAKSPDIWVRAMVEYPDRQLAKDKRFIWDGANKWWIKPIKACDVERLQKDCTFNVSKDLPAGYSGPQK